jgi:hypothetical protein
MCQHTVTTSALLCHFTATAQEGAARRCLHAYTMLVVSYKATCKTELQLLQTLLAASTWVGGSWPLWGYRATLDCSSIDYCQGCSGMMYGTYRAVGGGTIAAMIQGWWLGHLPHCINCTYTHVEGSWAQSGAVSSRTWPGLVRLWFGNFVLYHNASHRIPSHRIASHRIASHPIALHRNASYHTIPYLSMNP